MITKNSLLYLYKKQVIVTSMHIVLDSSNNSIILV